MVPAGLLFSELEVPEAENEPGGKDESRPEFPFDVKGEERSSKKTCGKEEETDIVENKSIPVAFVTGFLLVVVLFKIVVVSGVVGVEANVRLGPCLEREIGKEGATEQEHKPKSTQNGEKERDSGGGH